MTPKEGFVPPTPPTKLDKALVTIVILDVAIGAIFWIWIGLGLLMSLL